jgi:hypothetical protein
MTRYRLILLLALFSALLAGCGDSFGGQVSGRSNGPAPAPVPDSASIEVKHVLARSVPSTIDTFRFSGRDANGQTVYGPDTRARAASILLTGIPLDTRTLLIEYLDGTQVVGRFETAVELQPGQTLVINDPDWVDVIHVGPPVRLEVESQPTAAAPGTVVTPPLRVAIVDANGNLVESSTAAVTLSLADGPQFGEVGGTLTVNAVDGIARFDDLSFSRPGSYTLTAASEGLTAVTAHAIAVSGTPMAASFIFTSPPAEATGVLAPVTVTVIDQFGDPFTDFDGNVDLALGNNPSGASLLGTLSVAAVDGVATFSNLLVTVPGSGYTLIASASGLSPVASQPFEVRVGELDRSAFSLVTPVDISARFNSLASGDFNGDGRTDVAIADIIAQQVRLLEQTAEGSYEESAVLDFAGLLMVRAADLNGDSRPDLVLLGTPAAMNTNVSIFFNTGNGHFDPISLQLQSAYSSVADMVLADMDGDEHPDVVFAAADTTGGAVTVVPFNGTTLQAEVRTGLADTPMGLAVGAVTGDENLDAVVSVLEDVEVLPGDGSFGFGSAQLVPAPATDSTTMLPTSSNPTAIALGDFDGVNGIDVAVLVEVLESIPPLPFPVSVPAVRLLENDGSGAFSEGTGSPYLVSPDSAGAASARLRSADFDADGLSDLVVLTPYLTILRGVSGSGVEHLQAEDSVDVSRDVGEMLVSDLNDDHSLDVGIAVQTGEFVRLNGDGQAGLLPGSTPITQSFSVAKGDLNGDGLVDLAVAAPEALSVYLRDSDGTLPDSPSSTVPLSFLPTSIALGDLEDDGDLEVVLASGESLFRVYRNPGDGQFVDEPIQVTLPRNVDLVEVGDLDGDQRLDFAAIEIGSPGIDVGHGAAGYPYQYDLSSVDTGTNVCQDVRLADLDADGLSEIVTAQGTAGVGMVSSHGDPLNQTFNVGGEEIRAVGLGDLDGDGSTEVVAASAATTAISPSYGKIHVLSLQDGSLSESLVFDRPGLVAPQEAVVDDANGDGVKDILVSDTALRACAVLIGTGDGSTFQNGSAIHAGGVVSSKRSLVLVDSNGDGLPDPLFAVGIPPSPAGGTLMTLLTLLGLVGLRVAFERCRGAAASV